MSQSVLVSLGAITSVYLCCQFLTCLYLNLRPSSINRYRHKSASGDQPWALVTGSSDGLGQAIADELASRGFNIILHGRSSKKLEMRSARLRSRFPTIQTKVLVMDAERLPTSWQEFDTHLKSLLAPLHLTVLVNNVGGIGSAVPDWKPFLSRSHDELDRILNINASFMMHVTRTVLPLLQQSQPALILNIGSVASLLPGPYLIAYASGKAFSSMLTRALGSELKAEAHSKGIEVLALEPGKIVTNGSGRSEKDLGFDTLTTQAVAKAVIARVGCGYEQVVPNLVHQLQKTIVCTWLPESIREYLTRLICTYEYSQVEDRIKGGAWKMD